MVFKLVRVDAEEPNKIQLPVGTHLIGRGKFLDCEDKRISRNHGHLIITEDSVSIEALHQNPCFFTKMGSDEKQVLKKSCKETLNNGDKFGLLPGSYWYEVLCCPADMDSQRTDVSNTQELSTSDVCAQQENESQIDRTADKTVNENIENGITENERTAELQSISNGNSQNERVRDSVVGEDNEESLVNFDMDESVDNAARAESPSLLDQQNEAHDSPNQSIEPASDPNSTDNPEPPEPPPVQTESQPPSKSPKRSHSSDEDDVLKRIKTEPVDVKPEVKQELDDGQAGPSSVQGGSSDAGDSKPAPAQPVPPRERCLYGAVCYRRNIQHKAKFSHPTDADWGTGDTAPCPYGLACRKRDPRHWQIHEHPPMARPPAPDSRPKPKPRAKKRRTRTSDSDSSSHEDLVLTTKRARKPLPKFDGDSEDEDPYASDGSDDWEPPSDYKETQDTLDFDC